MNGQYLKNMPNDKYLKEARQWLGDAVVNENKLDTALMAVKTSLTTWKDIPVKLAVFTKDPAEPDAEAKAMLDTNSTRMVFKAYVDKVNKLNELTVDTFKTVMKDVQTETGVKGKNLWMPVRIGLTGEMHGPELGYIVEYLGKDENVKRIEKHLG
jgi:glutamyl/glutaminyl-tRNA synthetase